MIGVVKSLLTYWRPGRQRGLRRMYSQFVRPGDLVFDVGAHVGDRTAAFQALGARVVALEPQPGPAAWLNRIVGGRDGVTILQQAVGAEIGRAQLAVSRAHPTVSTLAHGWRAQIGSANPTFSNVEWDTQIDVPVTTLDELIATYGRPAFCKIDVEGFEAEVLAGLSIALPALSVEYVAGSLDVTARCVIRLETLGRYRYCAYAGEQRTPLWPAWRDAQAVHSWLNAGANGLSSGDLYARLEQTITTQPDQ